MTLSKFTSTPDSSLVVLPVTETVAIYAGGARSQGKHRQKSLVLFSNEITPPQLQRNVKLLDAIRMRHFCGNFPALEAIAERLDIYARLQCETAYIGRSSSLNLSIGHISLLPEVCDRWKKQLHIFFRRQQ